MKTIAMAICMTAWAGIPAPSMAGVPAERVVRMNATVPVVVDGVAGQLRIDPGAPGLPLLAPGYAAAAGLTGGGMIAIGVTYRVGRERVTGRTQVARIAIGGRAAGKRRVGWTARSFADGVEAVTGPGGVAEPVVRFVLREPAAGERTVAIPIAASGGMFGNWSPISGQVDVAGLPLRIRFAPYLAKTVVTAAAAAQLAEGSGGRLNATTGTAEIAFGLIRPVRGMTLARPLTIGPLAIPAVAVRTADTGSVQRLPTDADVAEADPDEIVVVAKGKRTPGSLTLGADYLGRCSSIIFDKPAKQVRLTCA